MEHNQLLNCIELIDVSCDCAEAEVLHSLIRSYDKAVQILENCGPDDDISAFNVFQEGKLFDQAKGNQNESLIKRIILFIPRLVKALIHLVISAYKSLKDRRLKKKLDKINKFDPDKNVELSKEFADAIETKNIQMIRELIAGLLYWRGCWHLIDVRLEYLQSIGIDIMEPLSGELVSSGKSEFDDDDFVEAVYNLKNNFCQERLDDARTVGEYVMKEQSGDNDTVEESVTPVSYVRQLDKAGNQFKKTYDNYGDTEKKLCRIEVFRKKITSNFNFEKAMQFMGDLDDVLAVIGDSTFDNAREVLSLNNAIITKMSDYGIDVKFDNTKWTNPMRATPITEFERYITMIDQSFKSIQSKMHIADRLQVMADDLSVKDADKIEYKNALNDLASTIRNFVNYAGSVVSKFTEYYNQLVMIVNRVYNQMKSVGVI